jgi:hypothetical protein
MQTRKWSPIEFKPECPNGWNIEERIERPTKATTSFVKWTKLHHAETEDSKIYAVFCEYSPEENERYRYSIRGGRQVKPEEKLVFFNDLKTATDYLVYLMECTDNWLKEILSDKYIKSYNSKISKAVEEENRRIAHAREVLEM